MAGVFAATLLWTGIQWLRRILPRELSAGIATVCEDANYVAETYKTSPLMNFAFTIFFVLTTYFYILTMMQDPGYVPRGSTEQKASVDELVQSEQFDDIHFCISCMTRRPLRSKHCKRCSRCVAKQDQ